MLLDLAEFGIAVTQHVLNVPQPRRQGFTLGMEFVPPRNCRYHDDTCRRGSQAHRNNDARCLTGFQFLSFRHGLIFAKVVTIVAVLSAFQRFEDALYKGN